VTVRRDDIVEHLQRRGITVLVKGASDEHRRLLTVVGTLAPLMELGHVFATFRRLLRMPSGTSPRGRTPPRCPVRRSVFRACR
jgi:hypothetical protein